MDPIYEENETQIVHVFQPQGKVKGDIVFLHGIGPNNIPYLEWYGRFFKKFGYRTSVVILPYHLERKPKDVEDGDPYYSPEPKECVVLFHNAVKDVRRSIDLLETFDDFSEDNLYLMGVSFGGIIGTMSLALDQRIKKGILMITGGNWRWINFYSPYTQKVRERYAKEKNSFGCDSEEFCKKFRSDAATFVKDNINSIEDIFSKTPITCYHYDSLSYAKFVKQPVFFVKGSFDKIMPHKATRDLEKLISNKIVRRIPAGHKSSYFLKRFVGKWVINFLEKEEIEQQVKDKEYRKEAFESSGKV
ncbi:alpha/beta hydrolase [Petrotoga sp. 9PW.55.5.1]|nr:alpha/beta hydrolase [Petrotoga sp. 9PW.55.5.1]